MSRIVRIVTSSFGTLEQVSPPFNLSVPTREENVQRASEILAAAGSYQTDLVLLPEAFVLAGMPAAASRSVAEEPGGPVVEMLAAAARAYRTNIVAGHLIREGGRIFNRALVLGRDGELVGWYDKLHPVGNERDAGVAPGATVGVFELDIGRIGVATCFDINWPDIWSTMAHRKVDLACWLSAYDGGFPLRSYAWQHQYPIVSSVYSYHAGLYDITGDATILTSRWQRIGYYELNLDRALFHADGNAAKIVAIQKRYGANVAVKSHTEEHLFVIECRDANLSITDVIREFELELYTEYISRCSAVSE